MKKSLLDVLIIYHQDDGTTSQYLAALQNAFAFARPDARVSQLLADEDPWERVFVGSCSRAEELESLLRREETSTLYVVMISDALVSCNKYCDLLDQIAGQLPKAGQDSDKNCLSYCYSQTAVKKLPSLFGKRQARELANLGEVQIRPYHLALCALERARVLLGRHASERRTRIFISHAKNDGVFLAQALKEAIDKVPELKSWYDATDLDSGSDWSEELEQAASDCVFIAVRTPNYDYRAACRKEFETALLHGVPIVVVDALAMTPSTDPSHLPFSAMPTVRISDGNTNRVVTAALREHLRILIMEEMAREKTVDCGDVDYRVWPRLPCPAAIKLAGVETSQHWLVPQALAFDADFLATRDWLQALGSKLRLEILERFRPVPSERPLSSQGL